MRRGRRVVPAASGERFPSWSLRCQEGPPRAAGRFIRPSKYLVVWALATTDARRATAAVVLVCECQVRDFIGGFPRDRWFRRPGRSRERTARKTSVEKITACNARQVNFGTTSKAGTLRGELLDQRVSQSRAFLAAPSPPGEAEVFEVCVGLRLGHGPPRTRLEQVVGELLHVGFADLAGDLHQ